jgi:hypothetical protein
VSLSDDDTDNDDDNTGSDTDGMTSSGVGSDNLTDVDSGILLTVVSVCKVLPSAFVVGLEYRSTTSGVHGMSDSSFAG